MWNVKCENEGIVFTTVDSLREKYIFNYVTIL